jgi:uncharacterized iron-regulated protein
MLFQEGTQPMFRKVRSILMLAIPLALTVNACAGEVITRVSDSQNVSLNQMISEADRSDLVFIGEAHDNTMHHEIQLDVIRSLWAKKHPLAIGLEMFQADSQKLLDDWTDGRMSEPGFQAAYARNWSLDWSLYRDIFIFARDNHIPMVALNIPKELVTKVSHQGYASLTSVEKEGLPQGTTCDLNNPHTAFLKKSFREVFKHVTNGRIFTYFCEAQTLRNSGMAMNIARSVKTHPGRKIVVMAGIWHAVKNAIPETLDRNGSKLTYTVILPELPELTAKNATSDVADYMIGR